MQESLVNKVRTALRNIPFVYQMYGLFRRIEHEIQLYSHTAKFKSGNGFAKDNKPIPPPKLRYRVHGLLSEESFMEGGGFISADIKSLLEKYADGLHNSRHYLDFGCGCARILRHLFSTDGGPKFYGTDIDPEAILWNKKYFGRQGNWSLNQPSPPTEYASGKFDVVVSISVFTHLDEELQFQWLEEIDRILSPDGIAILTVHGDSVWKGYPNILDQMNTTGFHFLRNYIGFWRFDGLPDFYQVTFHSKEYIYKHWSKYLDIIAYEENGILGHQSAVIVKKKDRQSIGLQP